MAAAYAALSSLLLTIDNILDDNHTVSVSLDRALLRSLHERATSLRECLQNMPTDARDDDMEILNTRILDVAFRIDDFIADTIHKKATQTWTPMVHQVAFLAALLCLLSVLGIFFMSGYPLISIFTILVCIVWIISHPYMLPIFQNLGNFCVRKVTEDQVLKNMLEKISSLTKDVVKIGKYIVVGMDSDLEEIMGKLTGRSWNSQKLKIIPIVGMGGIGKTTLATCIYEDKYIRDHFDVCMWATVSQEYRVRQVLIDLLASGNLLTKKTQQEKNDAKLGKHLYKSLIGRRYLIVMDDVWNVKIWNEVRRYFPERSEGSRVLLTTRLYDVAHYANSNLHQMRLLKEHESWSLLHDRIFGSEDCPVELRDIGDEIVKRCEGLPLALVVIGGLLSKVERTREKWRSLVDSLELATKDDDGDKCMKILALSYKHLPRHLRPCFLYMGMFPEDYMVPVTKLAQLWAAEGFLGLNGSKSPEKLAEEYLEELVKRNLILASSWCSQGKMKSCKIHDVLRKFCLQEARKKKFLYVIKHQDSVCETEIGSYLRLCVHKIHPNILYTGELCHSRACSLLCMRTNLDCLEQIPQFNYLFYKRVRVLDLLTIHLSQFPLQVTMLDNLRYLALSFTGSLHHYISNLRNLETIVHQDTNSHENSHLPVEIWMMPNLRHLHVPSTCLSNPPAEINNLTLQTLMEVVNMSFGIQVINRIKDLKTLSVSYDVGLQSFGGWKVHKLENLVLLNQMEKLTLLVKNSSAWSRISYPTNLDFPVSLKKLTLSGCRLPWERLTVVGVLSNLEVLKLRDNACQGEEWEPIEEQYGSLKLLELQHLDLRLWRADETHFPRLQRLTVKSCRELEEIPLGIGDIQTLQRIELFNCRPRVVTSVKNIKLEQDDSRDVGLEITIS